MTPKKRWNFLLADDGSEHAQSAVELLQSLPLPAASRIAAVRVFTPGQIEYLPGYERSLERTEQKLQSSGFKVETNLELGFPAEKIVEMAGERKPDLIVMGAKGLRATLGILLGGVAQQVVEYACCPVLVVRAPFKGLRRVLLVTDGSPSSLLATRFLARFPFPIGAEFRVMHVTPPIPRPYLMEPYHGGWQMVYLAISDEEEKTLIEKQNAKGETLLARTTSLLARHGIKSTPALLRGDAATEIIDYVKANQSDLIVAGSRGFSQFKSFWMGSVSRKLVHYAPCSVLIVKEPKKE